MVMSKAGRVALFACATIVGAACSTGDGRTLQPPAFTNPPAVVTTTAPAIVDDGSGWSLTAPWSEAGEVNLRYTCDDIGVSPPMVWTEGPEGTRAYGISLTLADDPDSVLWAVANIDPTTRNLQEGLAPVGAAVAVNSYGTIGYHAPCPMVGGTETYQLSVFALEFPVELPTAAPAADMTTALEAGALSVLRTTFSHQRR